MIPRSRLLPKPADWCSLMANAITDPTELLEILNLDQRFLPGARAAAKLFALRVPRGYVARMRKRDPADPLLRQVLPLSEEIQALPGYTHDPVDDLSAVVAPGLLKKYRGRALLITTGACAIHCRYCFRRHFPYTKQHSGTDRFKHAVRMLADHTDTKEAILSGGDPLALSDARLAALVEAIANIKHVHRLRIHTRFPVIIPERVTPALLALVTHTRLRVIIVIHVNHANELNQDTAHALGMLSNTGAVLLNQSVLLRGVNDSTDALVRLSETLFEQGVLPYYLHMLDRVHGAGHFDTGQVRARQLHQALAACLPGYLVPRLVKETPGERAKTLLEPLQC